VEEKRMYVIQNPMNIIVTCQLMDAAKFRGYSVVQKGAAKLSRMQHCSVKCRVAQEVAA
jgi:hypothetical protein